MDREDKMVFSILGLVVAMVIGWIIWAVSLPDDGSSGKVCPVIGSIAICEE